jgi:hypothetical protein
MFNGLEPLTKADLVRSVPHLTITDITDYLSCGLFYKFRRIDGIEMNPIPDEFVFRKVIRRVLTDFNKARMQGHDWSLMDLRGEFTSRWEQETTGKTVDYRPGKNLGKVLGEGRNLLEVFYIWFPWKRYEVASVNKAFSFKIDGIKVPIVGEIDLIENNDLCSAIVTDLENPFQSCSISQIDTDLKLALLHMAAVSCGYTEFGLLIRSVHMIRIKSPKIAACLFRKTETDIKHATKVVRAVWDGISSGVFIPNPDRWKCSVCGYKYHCNAWFNE